MIVFLSSGSSSPLKDRGSFSVKVNQSNYWSLRWSGMLSSLCWSVTPFRHGLSVPPSRVKLDTWTAWPLKIGSQLPTSTVQHSRRTKTSTAPQRNPEISHSSTLPQLSTPTMETLLSFDSKALHLAMGRVWRHMRFKLKVLRPPPTPDQFLQTKIRDARQVRSQAFHPHYSHFPMRPLIQRCTYWVTVASLNKQYRMSHAWNVEYIAGTLNWICSEVIKTEAETSFVPPEYARL